MLGEVSAYEHADIVLGLSVPQAGCLVVACDYGLLLAQLSAICSQYEHLFA